MEEIKTMTREQQINEAAVRYCVMGGIGDLFDTMAGFKAGAEWADQHPHWIPVEERLPEVGEPVLFFTPSMDEPLKGAYQKNGTWWSVEYECKFINGITHWMPLPAAPRKEE